MKYMGSKARLVKHILPLMLKIREDSTWVEPFVGGANMICEVQGDRVGYDYNENLIACLDALSNGWTPPEDISREFYSECRTKERNGEVSPIIGYVGINGSYGGRWFDGGYAGVVTTKEGKERNYPREAYKNVMNQLSGLKGVTFLQSDYKDIEFTNLPENSLIYCDPPYAGTKEYKAANKSGFDTDEFWDWCRDMTIKGHKVFISEYQAPEDFVCIWDKELSSSMRANGVIKGDKKSVERLFVHNNFYENNKGIFNGY